MLRETVSKKVLNCWRFTSLEELNSPTTAASKAMLTLSLLRRASSTLSSRVVSMRRCFWTPKRRVCAQTAAVRTKPPAKVQELLNQDSGLYLQTPILSIVKP